MLQASTLAGTPRPPLGCNCGRLPCTQRAPLHPERPTDPLDRSRCRRCRHSAFDGRTAAVRALPGVLARRLSQSVRCPPAPAQLPTHPWNFGSSSFSPSSMPLAIATVSAGDGAAHPVSNRFAPVRPLAEPLSGRIGPVRASHRLPSKTAMHVTHPDRPGPVCAENGVTRRPHTNPTSTLVVHGPDCPRCQNGPCVVAMC